MEVRQEISDGVLKVSIYLNYHDISSTPEVEVIESSTLAIEYGGQSDSFLLQAAVNPGE